MLPSELLDLFRVEMNDVAAPYLWSDDFVIGAIDDAQKQFARMTDGIQDSTTPEIVNLVVEPDSITGLYTDVLPLDNRILKIRTARRADTGRPVDVMNQEDMAPNGMYFDNVPGRLRALIAGMDENSIRLWPFPKEAVTVKLSVFRLPLTDVTVATADEPLEIATQHHRHLLLWVKHLAYGVQDAETFDRTKSLDFKASFETYCKAAKNEQARLRHKPRAVAYGGY